MTPQRPAAGIVSTRRRFAGVALVIATVAGSCSAWAAGDRTTVYRCVDSNGTVVFSDAPCGPDARRIQLPDEPTVSTPAPPPADEGPPPAQPPSKEDTPAASERSRVPGLDCPGEKAIKRAVHDHRVLLCMTADEVRAAEPRRYNEHTVHEHTQPDGSVLEEWIYRFHYSTWPRWIWFSGGHVVQVQD